MINLSEKNLDIIFKICNPVWNPKAMKIRVVRSFLIWRVAMQVILTSHFGHHIQCFIQQCVGLCVGTLNSVTLDA